MKSSTKDQAKGTFHEMKGKVKEIVGELSDNPDLEAEGIGEKIAGKVQKKIVSQEGLRELVASNVSCNAMIRTCTVPEPTTILLLAFTHWLSPDEEEDAEMNS